MSQVEGKTGQMELYMSASGKGCNMVTPSKKQNVFCELATLVEFIEGLRGSVTFTIAKRSTTTQSRLEDPGEDENE